MANWIATLDACLDFDSNTADELERLSDDAEFIAKAREDIPYLLDVLTEESVAQEQAESRWAELSAMFHAVMEVLEGRGVSDFMGSFGGVRLAQDVRQRADQAERERDEAREFAEFAKKKAVDAQILREAAEASLAALRVEAEHLEATLNKCQLYGPADSTRESLKRLMLMLAADPERTER